MRTNSRRWRASILLVLATLIGTSALGALQPPTSLASLTSGTGSSRGISVSHISRASDDVSIASLPGSHILSFAGDRHFDVEDSRSNWPSADAGAGLTPPTEQLSEAVFGGVQPSPRLGIAEPFLSLSARARN